MFFSALLNKLHNIKASFYDTLEYLKPPFPPVPSALEGLGMVAGKMIFLISNDDFLDRIISRRVQTSTTII